MIELRMLGRLSLTGADGREVRGLLGQPRRLALLAYLAAASPQGFHRRDTLLALFWPELDQEHARAALRQALHVVRDALGGDAVTSRGDEEIGLDFAQVWCDVAAFERALLIGQLEEALDLYRGALLEGFFISDAPEFERWLETERARLQQAAAGGARALAERHESDDDLTRAVRWTRRSIELAPSDEGLVRSLIALLDRQGDRAGALQAYEVFARRGAFPAPPGASVEASAGEARYEGGPLRRSGSRAVGGVQRRRPAGTAASQDPTDQQRPSVRLVPTREHARQPASESRERFGRDHAVRAHCRAGPELCRGSGRTGARLCAARDRIRPGGHGGARASPGGRGESPAARPESRRSSSGPGPPPVGAC